MNWKQLLFPRQVRSWLKSARGIKAVLLGKYFTILLRLGRPAPLARYLGPRRFRGRAVLYKQGILSYVVADRYVRFAASPRPIGKLEKEFSMWRYMREHGLDAILQRSAEFHGGKDGKILETDLLSPVSREEQVAATLPIIERLVASARPVMHNDMPATISAGLQLGRHVCGGALPDRFASEDEIRDCFARELLTGISHRDLHYRNVMRDIDGRPVLIDLKSCDFNKIISIDLLNFACKYIQARGRWNYLDGAFKLQQPGWHVPELAPVLALVDLPRPIWGQLLALHALGQLAGRLKSPTDISPRFEKSLLRVLSKNWRGVPS